MDLKEALTVSASWCYDDNDQQLEYFSPEVVKCLRESLAAERAKVEFLERALLKINLESTDMNIVRLSARALSSPPAEPEKTP